MKVLFGAVLACLVAVFTATSCSDKEESSSGGKYVEGKHWTVLKNPIEYTLEKGQDGVIWEIFSYSCSHCNAFEPYIEKWRKNTPESVGFEPVPVLWNANYETQATAFYTAKVLKVPDQAHRKLFDAIHVHRAQIGSLSDYAEFYTQFGINKSQFMSTSRSFVVKGFVDKARKISIDGKVEGTPTLIVNGKYLIETDKVPNRETILDVARYLVERDAQNK